ncbi:hypothetical protein [Burkholderia gladioli]|uniref:hypothetical protein n=1 Tax=Burkholderia gladioli TaxID=28095 RepID=UPI001641A983|nr:hypothetical protein [Burkholderia gladioli]
MSTEGANKESEVGAPACRWDYFTHPALRTALLSAHTTIQKSLFFLCDARIAEIARKLVVLYDD